MITLTELEAIHGAEVLLEVTSKLGFELKNSYEEDGDELSAILTEIAKSSTSTTSTPPGSSKKRTSESPEVRKSALDRTTKNLQDNQGAIVTGKTKAARAIAKVERNQGKKDATLANCAYAESFLETRSKGYEEFAASYLGADEAFSAITDQGFLNDEEDTETPLSIGGGFKLSF